jgi:hypothetical protein
VISELPDYSSPDALTPIPIPYTVSATRGEVDKVMIKNFINTLAEIALSIASREETNK